MGKGQCKVKKDGDTDGIGKTASNRKERMDWHEGQRGQGREGEDWNNNRKCKEWKSIPSHFLWSLIKVPEILILWPAQMSQLLLKEINLEVNAFDFYNQHACGF